jgi:hypothetical protein
MLDFLKFNYLIVSFCIGIFFVYISSPAKRLVNKFPGPHNSDLVFTDQNESCYKYDAEEVECDGEAKPQPVIEDFTSCHLNNSSTLADL